MEDIPIADAISQRSGSSEDKSSLDKTPIPSENKKREGNVDDQNTNLNEFRFRGSGKATSLLNLFVPQSQGMSGLCAEWNKIPAFPAFPCFRKACSCLKCSMVLNRL